MRSKSQQLMNEISAYVDQYYSERHTAPSVNEIAKGVGIAKTTSYRYLVAMNDLGMLRYDGASRDGRVDGMREMWKCHTEHCC